MSTSELVVTVRIPAEVIAAQIVAQLQTALNHGAARIADAAITPMGDYPPASSPGEPPNIRTANLRDHVHPIPDSGFLEAQVVSEADYSADLEFGTAKMAARPFLTPAVWQEWPGIVEDVAAALVIG